MKPNGFRFQLRTPRALWQLIALLFTLIWPSINASQTYLIENPNKVKAAFLRNFAHYVIWPDNAFPDNDSPWHIGILGQDPFGDTLETVLKGRTEQGRPFKVFRAENLEDLPACHIIFVAFQDATKRRTVLNKLKNRPVLTVGDTIEFLKEGGIIGFKVADRVSMNINLDQAHSVALTIQTKMLEVSNDILENGVIRQLR